MRIISKRNVKYWITGNKKFLLFKLLDRPRIEESEEEFKNRIFKGTTTKTIIFIVNSSWEARDIITVLNKNNISSNIVHRLTWSNRKRIWVNPRGRNNLPEYEENYVEAVIYNFCFTDFTRSLKELSKKNYKMEFLDKNWNIIIKHYESI